jgi:gluconate kinase
VDSLSSTTQTSAASDFTGWFPIRIFVRDHTAWVDWCWRGARSFRAPFFQEDAQRLLQSPFNLAFRRHTPVAALVEWADRCAREPSSARHVPLKAFVAHVSRCGSTLISQMLAHQPTHVVMSEPPMFDVLLGIRYRLPHVSRQDQIAWLRALVTVLGFAPVQERHLIIKLDAWHVAEYELVHEAFPQVPWIFLYRDPVEVAVSQLKQRATYMVPGMVAAISHLLTPEEARTLDAEHFIPIVLGKLFDAGAILCERGAAMPVNYQALPSAVWTELRDTLGIDDDAQTVAALQADALRDAKTPQMTFEPDSRPKQSAASATLRHEVAVKCADAYVRLEAMVTSRRHP